MKTGRPVQREKSELRFTIHTLHFRRGWYGAFFAALSHATCQHQRVLAIQPAKNTNNWTDETIIVEPQLSLIALVHGNYLWPPMPSLMKTNYNLCHLWVSSVARPKFLYWIAINRPIMRSSWIAVLWGLQLPCAYSLDSPLAQRDNLFVGLEQTSSGFQRRDGSPQAPVVSSLASYYSQIRTIC